MIVYSTLQSRNENGEGDTEAALEKENGIGAEDEENAAVESGDCGEDTLNTMENIAQVEAPVPANGCVEDTLDNLEDIAQVEVPVRDNPDLATGSDIGNDVGPVPAVSDEVAPVMAVSDNIVTSIPDDGLLLDKNVDVLQTAPKKAKGQSKKNRNIKGVLTTVKNKIENIQEQNGGHPNYLLLIEDNFSEVSSSGPQAKTNRKTIVTAAGDFREAFMARTLVYEPEKMIVLQKGKNLEQDFTFFEEYITMRNSQTLLNQAVENSPPMLTPAPSTPLVQLLSSLSKSPCQTCQCSGRQNVQKKQKRKRNKKRKVVEESSDSSTEDTDSNSSEEPRRKRNKSKKRKSTNTDKTSHQKKRKPIVENDSSSSDDCLDNLLADESTDETEEDNDPLHGTNQNQKSSKAKTKKPPPRQPKARKTKHDILEGPA